MTKMTKERKELEKLKRRFQANPELLEALQESFDLGWKEGHKTVTTDDWIESNF